MNQNNVKFSGDNAVRLLDLNSAAAYLGLSYWSLRGMLHNGEIPFIRAGRRLLVDKHDLNIWVERNKQQEGSF